MNALGIRRYPVTIPPSGEHCAMKGLKLLRTFAPSLRFAVLRNSCGMLRKVRCTSEKGTVAECRVSEALTRLARMTRPSG
jgi:hypothetical protein